MKTTSKLVDFHYTCQGCRKPQLLGIPRSQWIRWKVNDEPIDEVFTDISEAGRDELRLALCPTCLEDYYNDQIPM